MENIIFNGELIKRSDCKIDIEDRGYQFGDGVYEVIRVYNGKLFTAEEHLTRLIRSAENIHINLPLTVSELKNQLISLIEVNKLSLGTIYFQITRGVSNRNHAFPKAEPVYLAYTREADIPTEQMSKGVSTITVEDIRWLRCDIKSLNLLPNLLAKQKAVEAGCYEAIQHRNGTVTEGSSSNILIVKDGQIKTHPASNLILNGITRILIKDICHTHGIAFREEPFSLEELMNADEVFLTATTAEVIPVISIDNQRIGSGTPGSITQKLQKLFTKKIEEQCGSLL